MNTTALFESGHTSLGDILLHVGLITPKQLATAREQAGPNEKHIGQILVALGYIPEEKILKALSLRLGIPCFESFDGMIEPEAVSLIPEALARKYLVVPIMNTEDGLVVAMVNPVDIVALDDLALRTGVKILPVMTSLSHLMEAFDMAYRHSSDTSTSTKPEFSSRIERTSSESPSNLTSDSEAEDISVVASVNSLIQEAIARKASDIHLEPGEKVARVRFRRDGLLQEGFTFERGLAIALVARIKILSRLDITETRLPQDGRLRFVSKGTPVDIRVSTVPTVHGEKVVMRVLDSSGSLRRLSDMAFAPATLQAFSKAIRRPNRIILVTGPTGSGKTTTLYAALSELNDIATNIVTLEDPVEYRVEGLTQIETYAKIGMTFAAGLRAILRQDPNVILVGEIRDVETAEIAIQAAITGHRVFSTLHTSDAVTTIHRLITMRIEPFLIAAALGGVLAQRLVRRLCDQCKKPHPLTPAEEQFLAGLSILGGTFFDAAGCEQCFQTGYKSRLGIHEWLSISAALRELILQRASIDVLRAAAKAEGLRTLQQDALEKAAAGLTSLTEVFRVTQDDSEV